MEAAAAAAAADTTELISTELSLTAGADKIGITTTDSATTVYEHEVTHSARVPIDRSTSAIPNAILQAPSSTTSTPRRATGSPSNQDDDDEKGEAVDQAAAASTRLGAAAATAEAREEADNLSATETEAAVAAAAAETTAVIPNLFNQWLGQESEEHYAARIQSAPTRAAQR